MSLQNEVLEFRVIYEFALTPSPSLFPSDAVDAERRGRRPRAAPSSRPQPFHRPWFLPKPLDLATRRRSLHARREWTPNRHDDDVPSRPTRASSSSLLATIPFASQASSLPPPPLSFLLRAPARVSPGVQSRRRPPLAPPRAARRGAPLPNPPPPEIALGISPPPHPEALQPFLSAPPSLDRRRRGAPPPPAAPLRREATTVHVREPQAPPKVALVPLSLFPSGPPTAGASPRREKLRPTSSVPSPSKDPR